MWGHFEGGLISLRAGGKKKITVPLTFYLENNQEKVSPFCPTEYNLSLSNQKRM